MDERYLDLVMEECAEVIQCCTKIKRFGIKDSHPDYYRGRPNGMALKLEIGDLLATIKGLGVDLNDDTVQESFRDKVRRLETYGPDGTYLKEKKKREKINAKRRKARRSDKGEQN